MRSAPLFVAALLAAPTIAFSQSSTPPASDTSSASASPAPTVQIPVWTRTIATHVPTRAELREAHEHFQRGVEFTDASNFTGALGEFTRAYDLTHNPRVLFNISLSYEAIGESVLALEALHTFVAQAPHDVIEHQRAAIDEAEHRLAARIGTLVVSVDLPGLEVHVDGVQRTLVEVRAGLQLPAARHHVALSAPGYHPREADVDVAGGQSIAVEETLSPRESVIRVDANVVGASILIDDNVVGGTPTHDAFRVREGNHHVEVRRVGYTTYATDVNAIGPGAHVAAQLVWADEISAEVAAHLVIQLPETGAHASLDERGITLDGTDALPPGTHRLRIERTGRIPLDREVILSAAHTSNVTAALVPTVDVRQDRIRFVRTIGFVVGAAGLLLAIGGGTWLAVNEVLLASANSQIAMNQIYFDSHGMPLPNAPSNVVMMEPVLRQTVSVDETLRIPAGIIAGVGLGGVIAGIATVIYAPHVHTGDSVPTYRFRAGWQSVSFEVAF